MLLSRRVVIPLLAGLACSILLAGLYFGLVSIAESPQHALEFFWQDRWITIPIILGFGVQTALYTILKMRTFLPATHSGHEHHQAVSGASMGAGGATSTLAMAACCAHHVTDVLPILGLTAAATFLAQYRTAFMLLGLGSTLFGILYMLRVLIKERRKALAIQSLPEVL
jgi:hypothetical protein